MALSQNQHVASVQTWLRGYANARFARYTNTRFVRFMGVSAVALATSLILVGLCALWNVDPISAGLISQIGGAIVSYVLSRRAWERKGKPDLLRETIPFWIVFGIATVISTGATKLGYRVAVWSNLHGIDKVIVVEGIYLLANIATFLMRFVIFNYILFADRSKKGKGAAAGSDATGSDATGSDVTGSDVTAAGTPVQPDAEEPASLTQESGAPEPVAQDSAAQESGAQKSVAQKSVMRDSATPDDAALASSAN